MNLALEAVRVLAAVTIHDAGDTATVGYPSPPDTPAPGPPYLRVSRFRLLTVAADFVLSTILVGCTDDLFSKACKACKAIAYVDPGIEGAGNLSYDSVAVLLSIEFPRPALEKKTT